MPFSNFKKIIDKFPGIKYITICGYGEPLLTKNIFSMIKYAKSNNIYIRVASNGTLIDRFVQDIIHSGLDELIISIDSANSETFERFKNGANFDNIVRNIKLLKDFKKKIHYEKPILSCHSIITKDTIDDLKNTVRLCNDLDIKNLYLLSPLVYNKCIASQIVDTYTFKKKLIEAKKLATSLEVKILLGGVQIEKDAPITKNTLNCNSSFYINFDGTVNPCCFNQFSLGNIFTDSIDDILNNEHYKHLRILSESGECSNCVKDQKENILP